MGRRNKTAVDEGYLRSFWSELAEIEREYTAVCTVTLIATTQRGVFSVQVGCLQMGQMNGEDPLTFSVSKRLPDGGSLPFTGALWDMARKLNDMVTQAAEMRKAAHTQHA